MLDTCLNYYGIYANLNISLSLHKLEQLAFEEHPSGYENAPIKTLSLSYYEIKNLLGIYQGADYEKIIKEVFRYAAYFGLIQNVTLSPFHIEWDYNPYHQRDLFFAKTRLDIREYHKFSSII